MDLSRFLSSSQLELLNTLQRGDRITAHEFITQHRQRIQKTFSSAPQNFRDPQGTVMPDPSPEELMADASNLGQGYPKNEVFYITVIEDPPITMDPAEQKPPRMVLKPTPYLAPSLEIAFLMAGKDIEAGADLQRCRVRVAHG